MLASHGPLSRVQRCRREQFGVSLSRWILGTNPMCAKKMFKFYYAICGIESLVEYGLVVTKYIFVSFLHKILVWHQI